MKILGWILFFSMSSNTFAQAVFEPAPLSVEDDGTRKIITRKEGDAEIRVEDKSKEVIAPPESEAVVIPNDDVINPPTEIAKEVRKEEKNKKITKAIIKPEAEVIAPIAPVNPIDGQLKLDDGPATPVNTKALDKIDIVTTTYEVNPLQKYLQFSFGYINSRYEKIHPSLDNGSTMTSFRFVADMSQRWQSGFAVEILADTSGQTVPDNIRVVQYRLFVDHHAPLFYKGALRLDWVGGLGFTIGDFGIRRRYLNLQGQEVSVKLKDGIVAGLIPAAGLRIYLAGQNSVDLMVEYHQYFGNPQKYIGGLAISPRLSFEF